MLCPPPRPAGCESTNTAAIFSVGVSSTLYSVLATDTLLEGTQQKSGNLFLQKVMIIVSRWVTKQVTDSTCDWGQTDGLDPPCACVRASSIAFDLKSAVLIKSRLAPSAFILFDISPMWRTRPDLRSAAFYCQKGYTNMILLFQFSENIWDFIK